MSQPLIGQQFGNYRLVRHLGGGGFADVYLGQHIRIAKQQAAIKILHLMGVNEQQFLREAEQTASLRHPHIIRLYSFDIQQGIPFLTLEYAPHGSLAKHKGQRLLLETIIHYMKQITSALQYAHDNHIIHRDIKPDNILVGAQGELLVSDFGIAILVKSGNVSQQSAYSIAGTATYMAPEMFAGKPEKSSDQYALGIMVYAWLCGKPPFEGDFISLGYKHTHEPVPSLCEQNQAISAEVEQVVLTALSKDPGQRFGSVKAFAQALKEASQPEHAQMITRPLPPQPAVQHPHSPSVSLPIPVEPTKRGTPNSSADMPPVSSTSSAMSPVSRSGGLLATAPVASTPSLRRVASPSDRALRLPLGKRVLLLGSILLVLLLGSAGIFYWRANGNTSDQTHAPNAVLSVWQHGTPLSTARYGLAAVVGPDHRIYAIGGYDRGTSLNTVEVYDPRTNMWSGASSMSTAREYLAAVVGPDRRIYVIGGWDGSHDLNTVEVYDPQTKQWISGTPMPTARSGLTAVVGPDNRIYVIGGAVGVNALNTVEVYDPRTNTWSTAAPMPTARYGLAAVVGPDHRIYAIGGFSGGNDLNTVEVYDPRTNMWSGASSMPTARSGLAVVVGPDNRIYAIGGENDGGYALSVVQVYDPRTNAWSDASSMPTARSDLTAVVGPDNRIYVIGGYDFYNNNVFNVVEIGYGSDWSQ